MIQLYCLSIFMAQYLPFDSIRQQDGDEKRVSFRRLWLFLQFKNHFFQKDCSRDEMVVWIN